MPDLDERVTRLEERSDAHTRAIEHLRGDVRELRQEMHAFRAEIRGDLTAFRAEMRKDFTDLRADMDRRFTWLTGILVAGLVAVIGALVGAR